MLSKVVLVCYFSTTTRKVMYISLSITFPYLIKFNYLYRVSVAQMMNANWIFFLFRYIGFFLEWKPQYVIDRSKN